MEIRRDMTVTNDPRSTRVVVPRTQKSSSRLLTIRRNEMFSSKASVVVQSIAVFASDVVREIAFAVSTFSVPSTLQVPIPFQPSRGMHHKP